MDNFAVNVEVYILLKEHYLLFSNISEPNSFIRLTKNLKLHNYTKLKSIV